VSSVLVGETIAALETPVGFDGVDLRPFLLDTSGRIILVIGYNGTDYVPLKVNALGQLEVECKGTA
jgi:hypothetical protein